MALELDEAVAVLVLEKLASSWTLMQALSTKLILNVCEIVQALGARSRVTIPRDPNVRVANLTPEPFVKAPDWPLVQPLIPAQPKNQKGNKEEDFQHAKKQKWTRYFLHEA